MREGEETGGREEEEEEEEERGERRVSGKDSVHVACDNLKRTRVAELVDLQRVQLHPLAKLVSLAAHDEGHPVRGRGQSSSVKS